MNGLGAVKFSVMSDSVKSRRRILNYKSVKPQIPCHPHRRFDGIVRDDSGHDQHLLISISQPPLQIRSYEGTIRLLWNDDFAGMWCRFGFEVVPRLSGAVVRSRFG